MYVLTCLISFPDALGKGVTIRQVNEISITTSFKDKTTYAEVVLPKNVPLFNQYKTRDVLKRGDRVDISFGYDNNNIHNFSGYVASVGADAPIIVKCEDEMMIVKKIPVNYSAASTTLEEMLQAIAPGYNIDALEGVKLGGIRFSQTNFGAVIDKLQAEFSLYTYMKGKTIVCGKYYSDDSDLLPVTFDLDRGIKNSSLEFRYADDLTLKIKGVSLDKFGNKTEAEYGESGGDELTLSYYGLNQLELQKLLKVDYDKRKVSGFAGSFDGFGLPYCTHGMKVKFVSKLWPEREGIYYCDSAVKKFGQNGITQTLTIGRKALS